MTSRERWVLVAAVVLGAAARVVAVSALTGFGSPPAADGITYDLLARNVAAFGDYGFAAGDHTAFRAPAYPLLLAVLYRLAGPSLVAARLFNVVLGVATIVLVHRFSRQAFGAGAALLAAMGMALHPVVLYSTADLYPETLSLFLVALLGCLLVPFTRPLTLSRGAAAGAVIGALALTRPNVAPLVIFVVAGVGVVQGRLRLVRHGTAILAGFVIILLPWTIRNAVRFGAFVPLTTQGGASFWQANHPQAHGAHVWPDASTWREGSPPERGPRGWEGLSEPESSRRFAQSAWRWVRSSPTEALALVPVRLARLWSATSASIQGSPRQMTRGGIVVNVAYAAFALVAIAGMIRHRRRWRELLVLYAVLVTIHGSAAVFSGSTRYALPMAPVLVSFAAAYIAADRSWAQPVRRTAE